MRSDRLGRWKRVRSVALVWIGSWLVAGVAGLAESGRGTAGAVEPSVDASPEGRSSVSGQELYARHCAACHGTDGNGQGPAALFVFPKPRNFRLGKFKLISNENRVPLKEDIESVLVRGMPGSSMPPWAHLSVAERSLLVEEVLKLYRVGMRDEYAATLKKEEGLTDEELSDDEYQAEIREFVERRTTPEPVYEVPDLGAATPEVIARGKALYVKQSCHSCHGLEGKGDGVQKMADDDGLPTRPRDLTQGIYKGGHDVASLYRRTYLGVPGTPMPASPNLTPQEITDLVHFLRTLSTEEQREAAVMRRKQVIANRVAAVPASWKDGDWSKIPAIAVQTMPLWWRDHADAQLVVQAVHDGKQIALRMTWRDTSRNDSAVLSDEFEDLAAVELFSGGMEPFLGMGAEGEVIDLWQWRAGVKNTGADNQLSDEYPFDSAVYRELAQGKRLPDFVTARVAGNPLALREREASSLAAKGFGSTTFRPHPSQVVRGQAGWSDGRWAVTLHRPLQVPADAGLSLVPGRRHSVAFALWDGAARDRGGQKLVSLWNDLRLE